MLCRKFDLPIYCNALTAEAIRYRFVRRTSATGGFFAPVRIFPICDITVEKLPVPHDAVEPVGYSFHAGASALGYVTDLGHATRLTIERLREVQTLVIETNHDEKLLQNDPHRPWPVKQRIQSRHGHLPMQPPRAVIGQLLPGKIARCRARSS